MGRTMWTSRLCRRAGRRRLGGGARSMESSPQRDLLVANLRFGQLSPQETCSSVDALLLQSQIRGASAYDALAPAVVLRGSWPAIGGPLRKASTSAASPAEGELFTEGRHA